MGTAGPYSLGGVLVLAINRLQRFGVSPSTLIEMQRVQSRPRC